MMKEALKARCDLLLENRDAIKTVWKMESDPLRLCCAALYTMQGVRADEESMRRSKAYLKQRVGSFSNFRSTGESVLASKLDLSGNPEQTLENALNAYDALKRRFFTSSYLPMAALSMAEVAPPARFDEMSERCRTIYDRIRREHPLLTGSDDVTMCMLMALDGRNIDVLIENMEADYNALKPQFFGNGNQLQTLSHVLALCAGRAAEKTTRVMSLYNAFKDAGCKWGTAYELPILGLLALCGASERTLLQDTLDCDAYLKEQKGFSGFFSVVTAKQRLMYAGLMAYSLFAQSSAAENTVISATMAMVIAQQTAIAVSAAAATTTAATT